MAEQVRLWRITQDDTLDDVPVTKLDLEDRLETWIQQDVSVLYPGLMVIGRQVETDYGGIIDLLCIDREGNSVVVELKRDMTPREVTAQALDYASWVRDLTSDRLTEIANNHLGDSGPLEEAFARHFGSDLPEVLNESHSIFVVASQIDSSTERIIKYLSEAHGVSINAITFHYFKTQKGDELIARLFLIEPETLDSQSRARGPTRRRNLSPDELQEIADQNGVGELYRTLVSGLSQRFARHTTVSSIAFTCDFQGTRRTIFSLIPESSSKTDGLCFQLYALRACTLLGLSPEELQAILPGNKRPWRYATPSKYYEGPSEDWSGFSGYFCDTSECVRFLNRFVSKK